MDNSIDEQRKEMDQRIRDLRVSYKLSAEDFAHLIGLSSSFIGLVERGQRGIKLSRLLMMCELFHVSLDYLVFGKNECNTPEKIADNPVLSLGNTLSEYELEKLCDFGRQISLHNFTKSETDSLFAAFHELVMLMKRNKRGA